MIVPMSTIESVTASENGHFPRVAICGGAITGLTLAARVAAMGHRPVVFEARSEAQAGSEGVFLTLAPNGANGLRAIGCFDEVKAKGIDNHRH
jgi:2-polyprenyl-6-methoxyphenol hydroxylase-like FAD-dependent oxidoreductase